MRGTKKHTAKPLSKRVAKLEREFNRAEVKWTEKSYVSGSIVRPNYDASGVAQGSLVAWPIRGLTSDDRVGDQIEPTSVDASFSLTATSGSMSFVRLVVVQYKNTLARTTALAVLTGLGQANAPNGNFNNYNRSEFTVLHDKRYFVAHISGTSNGKVINLKLYPKHRIVFDPVNATPLPIEGDIYFYAVGDLPAAGTVEPVMYGYAKLNYTDC